MRLTAAALIGLCTLAGCGDDPAPVAQTNQVDACWEATAEGYKDAIDDMREGVSTYLPKMSEAFRHTIQLVEKEAFRAPNMGSLQETLDRMKSAGRQFTQAAEAFNDVGATTAGMIEQAEQECDEPD